MIQETLELPSCSSLLAQCLVEAGVIEQDVFHAVLPSRNAFEGGLRLCIRAIAKSMNADLREQREGSGANLICPARSRSETWECPAMK